MVPSQLHRLEWLSVNGAAALSFLDAGLQVHTTISYHMYPFPCTHMCNCTCIIHACRTTCHTQNTRWPRHRPLCHLTRIAHRSRARDPQRRWLVYFYAVQPERNSLSLLSFFIWCFVNDDNPGWAPSYHELFPSQPTLACPSIHPSIHHPLSHASGVM